MTYKTIKTILRSHIKNNVSVVWQWDIEDNNFICTFGKVDGGLPLYTPAQLLSVLMGLKEV
tara:strand:+ start:7988 stop:8170 length:183 start_codon:yes stop_codon:yes gene_type:complete